jgi:hypothetical protein
MYYYIKYSITTQGTAQETECVADKHPFDWLKFYDSFNSKWNLIDWKKISVVEYEKGKLTIGVG